MSVISQVDCFALRWKYPEPIFDARSMISEKTSLLIKLTTRDGATGWGEAAAFGGVPEIIAKLICETLFPLIKNREPSPRDLFLRLLRSTAHYGQRGLVVSALSGLEIACWDLLGQLSGLPVAKLLGGSLRPIGLYASTGYFGPSLDALPLDEQISKVSFEHFKGVKIKVGKFGISEDLERVKTARKLLPNGKVLIADANNAYRPKDAVKFAKSVEEYDLLFLEEPIEFGFPVRSKEVNQFVSVGGFELENTLNGYLPYIQTQAVDFIQPDAIWSGGIFECLMISEMAKQALIQLVPHNFSTVISLAANFHLLSASNNGDLLEFDSTGSPFIHELSPLPFQFELGECIWNDTPGLGVDIDVSSFRQFCSLKLSAN